MNKNLLLCLFSIFFPIICIASVNKVPLAQIAEEYHVVDDKIYFDSTQLLITNGGIYFFVNGQQIFTEKISCDSNGIYSLIEDIRLDSITDRCRLGHRVWCTRCWGCVVRDCPYHCSCVAWP